MSRLQCHWLLLSATLVTTAHSFAVQVKAPSASPTTTTFQPIITWEKKAAEKIRSLLIPTEGAAIDDSSTFMVAVVGIPGSGKSTCAEILKDCIGDDCFVFPHDGYHFSLNELEKQFPGDAHAAAVYRRGAPDTFDAPALRADLRRIRDRSADTLHLPGFDHAVGDPEPRAHCFDRSQHRIVICEGLYLMHERDGWEGIADMFDVSIFIDANVDVCMDRLKIRNQAIPGYSASEISCRVDAVDRVNANMVYKSKNRADWVYESMLVPPWRRRSETSHTL